ncbi:MAG: nicotinamide mononucleotide deamidase-related protein [Candidatus Bathyarchaeota archaeon]|nr:nicotinamide mononucleotide deamidase-related protein [Candidatus Bathyarchaeota archaeon]
MTVDMEIVCIGNELLIGKVVNTNASWMGKRATSLGVAVKRITVVADNIEEMATAFHEVLARKPRFVVTTGGLGPTFDDKTLEGIAKALNRNLAVNQEALDMVKAKYAKYAKTRNIPEGELTPAQVKMATLPEGTMPLVNPVGTAPGVRVDVDGAVLFVLPGVPREMEAIFEASLMPLLRSATGDVGFFELSLYVDNLMESVLAPLIDNVMHENPLVYIKSHPKGREGTPNMGELHLSTSGLPSENPQERLKKAAVQLSVLMEKTGAKVVRSET